MTQFRVIAAVAITGMVAAMPAAAQGKSGAHVGGPTTTTHGKPAGAGAAATARGKSTTTTATTARGRSADHRPSSSTTTSATSTTTTTSTTTATTTATALSTKISQNPNQLARISAMLPAGMTLDQATAGFRNQGQFIAALNASKNQGVSFVDLQKAMTVDGMSLGQAVRQLKNAPDSTTTNTTSGSTTTTGTNSTSDSGTSGSNSSSSSTSTTTSAS